MMFRFLRKSRVMTYFLILFGVFSFHAVQSYDSDSAEMNRIEVSPIYETIIFSDVADIINDYENNMNSPFDVLLNSGSESEENVEDLLSEYQHYLDKAHKQRVNYLEKTKTKNKVPVIRHERFTKNKPGLTKNDDYFYANGYYGNSRNKFPQTPFNSPLNLFMSPKLRYVNEPELSTPRATEYGEGLVHFEKKLTELPPLLHKTRYEPIKPDCICKSGPVPCDCKCKRCLITFDERGKGLQNPEYVADERLHDINDDGINVHIKIDVALPKALEMLGKLFKNRSREELIDKEIERLSNIKYTTHVDFDKPSISPQEVDSFDLFGLKRSAQMTKLRKLQMAKHDLQQGHKITVHKKKKTRLNNSNKKHRKKVITYHNINIEPETSKMQHTFGVVNINVYHNKTNDSNNLNQTFPSNFTLTVTEKVEPTVNVSLAENKTVESLIKNDTQPEESIHLLVNISNNSENGTTEAHKNENSVENEYPKTDTVHIEKISSPRIKREASTAPPAKINIEVSHDSSQSNDSLNASLQVIPLAKTIDPKKSVKNLISDSELLYWPNNTRNSSVIESKNITTIIMEREHKKGMINMTKETIRNNRTRALEKAIFGDVNWDDVDTVAPVFLSFVGKYIRGVLTFCSQNVCHSMKCAEKTCVHRICTPNERWNHRGHCAGSNTTDSVASLESIMDLPSNIAFEIVEILQDKMLGKMYGEVTLCISSKCISFVACKKNFLKSKCSMKEVNKQGHCPNIKIFKVM